MSAPIFGLILAGGASTRMQSDKAALEYQGTTQLARAYALASRHCTRSFVSVRAQQVHDPVRGAYPLIVDAVAGEGPLVGIRSALAHAPDNAWLVLACDLPFLSDAALAALIEARDASLLATCYASAHDGKPEPLAALWEPHAAAALGTYAAAGGHCPRTFLMRHAVKILDPADRRALDNINTPQEYAAARAALESVS